MIYTQNKKIEDNITRDDSSKPYSDIFFVQFFSLRILKMFAVILNHRTFKINKYFN